MRGFALVVIVLAAAAGASAAVADRSVRTATAVAALGASGGQVAYAETGVGELCGRVTLWDTATRAVIRFPRAPRLCPATSTGSGIAGVQVASGRLLWLSYAGGNIREWTLYTATRTARAPRRVRFVARDVDAPPPIVLGRADEQNLPYAVDRQVIDLRPNGSRRFAWTAPERVVAVAAGFGKVAVLLESSRVVVLGAKASVLAQYDFEASSVRALRVGAPGVIVQTGNTVLVRNRTSTRTYTLPPGATLLDYVEGLLLYAKGPDVRARRLSDRRDVLLTSPGRRFLAALPRRGLAYARGRTVSWRSWVGVTAAVNGY